MESRFFQNPRRSSIIGKRFCKDANEAKILKCPGGKLGDCFRHNALSPKRLSEPVSQFCRFPMNVLPEAEPNAPDRLAPFYNCKTGERPLVGQHREERFG